MRIGPAVDVSAPPRFLLSDGMSTSTQTPTYTTDPEPPKVSAGFGLAFAAAQLAVMSVMVAVVLPHGGGPSASATDRGGGVLDAIDAYRVANFAFMASGTLLLGFLGVVRYRLHRADATGTLATVAVAAGTLLALIWPLAGMLHDVALEAAAAGTDVRLLGAWDSVAPFGLAFSALPRLFFIGAIVVGLRRTGAPRWLLVSGLALLPLAAIGSATLVVGALFPVLAVGTLGYELWIAALAWHWLRTGSDH